VSITAAQLTAVVDPIRTVVGVIIGAFVMISGGRYLVGGNGAINLPGIGRATNWLASHVDRFVKNPGVFGLGTLHGLLPCPIHYPAYLFAFATGSTVTGGIILAVLGLGTIPTVFAYGTLV
jgi:sulfite exporter TauE/SafE